MKNFISVAVVALLTFFAFQFAFSNTELRYYEANKLSFEESVSKLDEIDKNRDNKADRDQVKDKYTFDFENIEKELKLRRQLTSKAEFNIGYIESIIHVTEKPYLRLYYLKLFNFYEDVIKLNESYENLYAVTLYNNKYITMNGKIDHSYASKEEIELYEKRVAIYEGEISELTSKVKGTIKSLKGFDKKIEKEFEKK